MRCFWSPAVWEQDPCPAEQASDHAQKARGAAAPAPMAAAAASAGADLGVRVEAEFTVGEYEVVVLSARDSDGLDTWLHQNNYKIPDGAEPLLRPYVAKAMKFFVAKVNASKVKFENGQAVLSPLRFHYDADDFSLPVRLGMLNSDGKQELVVHLLGRGKRYEVANYPNVIIPTNYDVAEEAREKFGPFYAALFDATMEKHPGAVVTEYAWDAQSCDPCPGPTLQPSDMLTLGADSLSGSQPPSLPTDPALSAVVSITDVTGGEQLPDARAWVQRDLPSFTQCYTTELGRTANPKGSLKVAITMDAGGRTKDFTVTPTGTLPATLASCVDQRWRRRHYPAQKREEGKLAFTVRFDLEKAAPGQGWWKAPPANAFGFTLTRLHTRYAKDALGQDLIFREATPIVGGREDYGAAEQDHGAKPGGSNNFQARYAIRHPWTGPIACAHPRYGVWGGPPAGTPGDARPKAAQKIAFVPRGGVQLASLIRQSIPDLGLTAPVGATPSRGTSARGACGCEVREATGTALPSALATFAALVLGARRRRRRRAPSGG